MLAITSAKGWKTSQLDVPNAFLNGDLQEEMYVQLSQSYGEFLDERIQGHSTHGPSQERMICHLFIHIYGLKQVYRYW